MHCMFWSKSYCLPQLWPCSGRLDPTYTWKKWKLICLNAGRVETNRAFFPKLAWGAIIVCAFVYKTVCGMHGAYCNGKIVQFQVSVVEQVFQISDQYMDDELLWPGKWKLVATALWPKGLTWFFQPIILQWCVCAENVATALRDANTHVQIISPDRTRQKL